MSRTSSRWDLDGIEVHSSARGAARRVFDRMTRQGRGTDPMGDRHPSRARQRRLGPGQRCSGVRFPTDDCKHLQALRGRPGRRKCH